MPITLIRESLPFTVTVQGSDFTVRQLTLAGKLALRRRHTTDGALDRAAYMADYWRACVLGWTVTWADDTPAEFDPDLLAALDLDTKNALIDAIEGGPPDPLAGRSGTTLPSSSAPPSGLPPTKD